MNKNKTKTKKKKKNWKCNHAASFNIGLSSSYDLFGIHSRKKTFKCWKCKMRARFKPIDFSFGLQFHLSLDPLTSPSFWAVLFFLSFLFKTFSTRILSVTALTRIATMSVGRCFFFFFFSLDGSLVLCLNIWVRTVSFFCCSLNSVVVLCFYFSLSLSHIVPFYIILSFGPFYLFYGFRLPIEAWAAIQIESSFGCFYFLFYIPIKDT